MVKKKQVVKKPKKKVVKGPVKPKWYKPEDDEFVEGNDPVPVLGEN